MDRAATLRPVEILLVEDSPGDVRLTQEALREGKVRNRLHVVSDGVQALAFLRREGEYAATPRPDVVLLDLNLPKKDGHEVLAELGADDRLGAIPVVVLTASRDEADRLRSHGLGAAAYITKPPDLEQFVAVVRSIEAFWLSIVVLTEQSPELVAVE